MTNKLNYKSLTSVEPPVKKVENPHAIARPHATPLMLQRQGSFRVFQHLNQVSDKFFLPEKDFFLFLCKKITYNIIVLPNVSWG